MITRRQNVYQSFVFFRCVFLFFGFFFWGGGVLFFARKKTHSTVKDSLFTLKILIYNFLCSADGPMDNIFLHFPKKKMIISHLLKVWVSLLFYSLASCFMLFCFACEARSTHRDHDSGVVVVVFVVVRGVTLFVSDR